MRDALRRRHPARRAPRVAAALVPLLFLLATGCAPESSEPTASPTASAATPTPTPEPVVVAPLTGLEVAEPPTNPSLAAKIDNHPGARPQLGLEQSDLVFEELVEGGLTRYVAVWQSQLPGLIGPVRSIRPMDPDIVSPFGGIIAYSGGQDRFVRAMKATAVYNAVHGQADTASTFFRTTDKRSPHNVLVRAPELVADHAELPAPAPQFAFAETAAESTAAVAGAPSATIALRFGSASTPSWALDAATGRWVRSQGGAADLDSNGAQLSAANVVTMRVTVDNSLGLPETQLIASGEAWVSSAGSTVHGSWSKASATAPIVLTDDAGAPILLAPGSTWIELVPTSGSVAIA